MIFPTAGSTTAILITIPTASGRSRMQTFIPRGSVRDWFGAMGREPLQKAVRAVESREIPQSPVQAVRAISTKEGRVMVPGGLLEAEARPREGRRHAQGRAPIVAVERVRVPVLKKAISVEARGAAPILIRLIQTRVRNGNPKIRNRMRIVERNARTTACTAFAVSFRNRYPRNTHNSING